MLAWLKLVINFQFKAFSSFSITFHGGYTITTQVSKQNHCIDNDASTLFSHRGHGFFEAFVIKNLFELYATTSRTGLV